MTKNKTLTYFLLPHMTLSERNFRNLCVFLPRLEVLEIVRQAPIPEWAHERISGRPVLRGGDLHELINSCIEGYRAFAQVHAGSGGMLAFLSQALDEIDETRFRIQEELRGRQSAALHAEAMGAAESLPFGGGERFPAKKEIVRSALFLEIARDLDEKELEIESGYERLSAMEKQFRNILGIEKDELERAEADLTPPLAPEVNGMLYMLPRRIESWYRMLSLQPIESMPVFVTYFPEVADEALEMVRTGCERNGKRFLASTYPLGPVPRMDYLGGKQFRSLIEAPGMTELLSCCHTALEDFIKCAAMGGNPAELEGKGRLLRGQFEGLCRKCVEKGSESGRQEAEGKQEAGGGGGKIATGMLGLSLTVVGNGSLADLPGFSGVTRGPEAEAWPPVFLSVAAG